MNPHKLATRALTAAIFAISTAALIFIHPLTCTAAMAVLAGFCSFEFYAMLRNPEPRIKKSGEVGRRPNEIIGVSAAVFYPIAFYFYGFNVMLLLTAVLALVLLVWYAFDLQADIVDVAVTLFGALYTGMLLAFMVWIREFLPGWTFLGISHLGGFGGLLAFLVILAVWANDAFAYLFGSIFGKHQMAPKISPAKSWEGFAFGMLAPIIVWVLISFIPGVDLSWYWGLAAGLLCGLATTLGDLIESRIKRGTGHKDSGHALPGHGGFLDRCDSLFLVTVCAAFVLWLSTAPDLLTGLSHLI
ncbi:MAG: phosphatidate cytidylyltransferase [Coriobacteriales bacterium]|nr:phosphatidate cytidylyltransferase [Coriobacteriales bacterium]